MLPNRVGEPSARPMHSSRSFSSTYGAPASGTAGSAASGPADTFGTVRTRAAQPATLSTPLATSCAIRFTAQKETGDPRVNGHDLDIGREDLGAQGRDARQPWPDDEKREKNGGQPEPDCGHQNFGAIV